MKIDVNDPRWTAYALGELEDEKERAELEKILRDSEEMRQMVEEIRQTAELLNDSLKKESFAGLTAAQRKRISAQSTKRPYWIWSKPVWAVTGVAAALALSLSVWMYRFHEEGMKSSSPDTQIAELRKERNDSEDRVRENKTMQPEVELHAQSVTVVGSSVEKFSEATATRVVEHEATGEPKKEETSPKQAKNEKSKAQDIGTESSSTTGTVLTADAVKELPLTSNEIMAQAKIMGGVQPSQLQNPTSQFDSNGTGQSFAGVDASQLNIEQDGITANDVRYKSDVSGGSRINTDKVSEFRMVLSPVEAEMGRGSGQLQARWPPEERRRYPIYASPEFNTEGYASILDNPFMEVVQNPLSTFSIDVDTASYSNVRRFLEQNQLPPKDAVRIEELVNYFDYDYQGPGREGPFAAHIEMTEAPWNSEHRLLRIGLKAKEIQERERPKTNLVFLIDVSGSMGSPNKLPLVQNAMHMLIDRLTENDRVAIVTYAGSTRVELRSTRGDQKWSIHRAIDRLRSGGSTAGASGIQLAYETAERNFIKGGANRVILATDGDFNVGITNHGDLARLIEEKADSGVFMSALGFGMGNYKDDTLELLADKGRGNYAYIDTIDEARKVLVEQINATLVSVAKDVKIQVEFNPERVGAYRLIGYEDRIMPKEDFNNDTKKAGVIGAGHAVTALYEIVPAGMPIPSSGVDPLKYQKPVETTKAASGNETATVKIRYKNPDEEESRLMEFAVRDSGEKFGKSSGDFKFAASVAAFGMVLRDSPYKGSATLEDALDWAKEGQGKDAHGYRAEFIRLLHRAVSIKQ